MKGNIVINTGNISGDINQSVGLGSMVNEKSEADRIQQTGNSQYDIAISYANEQIAYVRRVVKILKAEGIKVFFEPDDDDKIIGEDAIEGIYKIYRYQSLYIVCFVSPEYLVKDITMHEAKTAMVKSKHENRNCLIPISFNGARIPDLDPDIIFIDADRLKEVEVADKLVQIVKRFRDRR